MNWINKRFGDCAELIRSSVKPEEVTGKSYIGLEHISQGQLSLIGFGKSDDVISQKFLFKKGDILFGKLRPYFRKVIIAPFDGVCSTDIWVVRAKQEIDQRFLFYWMATSDFIESASMASEGTKMPRAQWEFVSRLEKEIPGLSEQRAIAEVLSSLDDKIELNRRMNETLENLSEGIFKNYFIDNPGKQKWRKEKLINVTKEIVGGDWGKDIFDNEYNKSIICIRGADISNLQMGGIGKMPLRYISESSYKKRKLQDGDIVIEISGGSPTQSTGRTVLISQPFLDRLEDGLVCSNFCRFFRLNDVSLSKFIYFWLRFLYSMGNLFQYETGTTGIKNFNFSIFSQNYSFYLPPKENIEKFNEIISPLLMKIQNNAAQIEILISLRDILLYKLLKGEIKVKGL